MAGTLKTVHRDIEATPADLGAKELCRNQNRLCLSERGQIGARSGCCESVDRRQTPTVVLTWGTD